MAIKFSTGFDVSAADPIDTRIVLTKEQMANVDVDSYPDVYFAFCIDDGQFYRFDYPIEGTEVPDPETGFFTKLELGGTTPTTESGSATDMPDPDDKNPGDQWYDPETGKTYTVAKDSEGNNQWVEKTPTAGEMMFDETSGKILYFDGNEWKEVGALSQTSSGNTAPSSPQKGDKWLDTSTTPPTLKEYGEDGQWHAASAKEGDMMYDATNDQVMYYDGTQWKPIGGGVEHVSTLPSAGEEGEIVYDESTGQYKIYEDGVWLTLAKTWEGTEAEYTTLGGDTWSTAHPDVILFVK